MDIKDNVIFDLDDYGEHPALDCFDLLKRVKDDYPNLKVTLFGIPHFLTQEKITNLHSTGWIEVAMHGWKHLPWNNAWHPITGIDDRGLFECERWSTQDAIRALELGEAMGFVHGFKAPYWAITQNVIDTLSQRGWWLADHSDHKGQYKYTLPVYWSRHSCMVHGHTWGCASGKAGLDSMIENGLPFYKDTRFYFISEALKCGLL